MTEQSQKELVTELYQIATREKGVSIRSLHQSFTWSFSVVTLLAVGLPRIGKFPSTVPSWLIVNIAIPFITYFFVRSMKEYLNQVRFAHIQKECVSFLFNIQIGKEKDSYIATYDHIKESLERYFIRWTAPTKMTDVLKKGFFELGYVLQFAIAMALWLYISKHTEISNDVVFYLIPIISVIASLGYFVYEFRRYYFECEEEALTMKGLR